MTRGDLRGDGKTRSDARPDGDDRRQIGRYAVRGAAQPHPLGHWVPAFDPRLERSVHLLRLTPQVRDDPRWQARVRALSTLESPAIVRVFEAFETHEPVPLPKQEITEDEVAEELAEEEATAWLVLEPTQATPPPTERAFPGMSSKDPDLGLELGLRAAAAVRLGVGRVDPAWLRWSRSGGRKLDLLAALAAQDATGKTAIGELVPPLDALAPEASVDIGSGAVTLGDLARPTEMSGETLEGTWSWTGTWTGERTVSEGLETPTATEVLQEQATTGSEVLPTPRAATGSTVSAQPQGRRSWSWQALAVLVAAVVLASWMHWRTSGPTTQEQSSETMEAVGEPVMPGDRSGTSVLSDPGSIRQRLDQGWHHLESFDRGEHLEAAETLFTRVLEESASEATEGKAESVGAAPPDPLLAEAFTGLARTQWLWFRQRQRETVRLDAALEAVEEALQLDPERSSALALRGLIRFDRGEGELAADDLARALALDPASADAHRGQGLLAAAGGDNTAALEAFRRAVQARPDDRVLHDQLGSHLYRLGRFAEAEASFRTSLELADGAVASRRNLAASLYMQDRLGEAASVLQEALRREPSASLYSNLGTILFAQELYRDAASAFEKALDQGGGSFYLRWANLADAYRRLPDHQAKSRQTYDRAIALLDDELARQPTSPLLLSRRALYLAKASRCDAVESTVATLGPVEPLAGPELFRLAVVFELCGDRQRALDTLGLAFEQGTSEAEARSDPELAELWQDPRAAELGKSP